MRKACAPDVQKACGRARSRIAGFFLRFELDESLRHAVESDRSAEPPLVLGKNSSMPSPTARTGAMSSLHRLTSMRSFTPALRALPHPGLEKKRKFLLAFGAPTRARIAAELCGRLDDEVDQPEW